MQHPIVTKLASTAAVAAFALAVTGGAGAAEAATRPDDRATRGPGAVALTNDGLAAERTGRPDDRPMHGPGAIAAQHVVVSRPDDRADRRLPNTFVSQPTSGDAFDWLDAGIGSAMTFGLVLLAVGASIVRLRHGARTA